MRVQLHPRPLDRRADYKSASLPLLRSDARSTSSMSDAGDAAATLALPRRCARLSAMTCRSTASLWPTSRLSGSRAALSDGTPSLRGSTPT